jgi:hypothetical protein
MLQLSDIAGPRGIAQRPHRSLGDLPNRLMMSSARSGDEVLD